MVQQELNPNVLFGAIVGDTDENDGYTDSRSNFQMAEPATVNTAPLVGDLAKFPRFSFFLYRVNFNCNSRVQ